MTSDRPTDPKPSWGDGPPPAWPYAPPPWDVHPADGGAGPAPLGWRRPQRRHVGPWIAALTGTALLTSGVTAAVIVLGGQISSRTAATALQSILPGSGTVAPPAGRGGTVPLPAGGSPAEIEASVDPAVVNITATVADGMVAGTGIVLTSSGEVLTNNHVVEGATTIMVQIDGHGPNHSAHVVGVDVSDDVAVVQIESVSGLSTATMGDSSTVSVGEPVIAIGNALGKGGVPTASEGAITAVDQTITATDAGGANAETLNGLLQISAPIQPGDSGGPLVDHTGAVIGMDTAASAGRRFRRRTPGSMVGFAIPITTATSIAAQIESGRGGSAIQPGQSALLGVELDMNVDGATSGALVGAVQAGGPAARAGIAAGDMIVSFDGAEVGSAADLRTGLHRHRPGDRVTVGWVDQSGAEHDADVRLDAGPPA